MIITPSIAVVSGVGVISFGAGGVLAHILTKKQLEAKYAKIADGEIQQAKEFYRRLGKREEFSTPEGAADVLLVKEAVEAVTTYSGLEESTDQLEKQFNEIEEARESNIFVDNEYEKDPGAFVPEIEIPRRSTDEPYIITHDEFMQNESEYEQVTITYFEGDDTLVDEKDEIIDDVERTIGYQSLQRFGHASKDNKIVYVRNDRLTLEFEVIKSKGKYTEQVLGFIEHSDRRPQIRRFRGDDE